MKHVSTNRLSTSMFSIFCVALATADFTTFSISRVAFGLLVNFSVISASFTFLPRIRSTDEPRLLRRHADESAGCFADHSLTP